MAYEIKELSGSLFVNENKEHDRQPDYTGNIKLNGKTWRLAAWKTVSRSNIEYLSIKISDPADFQRPAQDPVAPTRRLTDEEFRARRNVPPRRSPETDFDDDDIPF